MATGDFKSTLLNVVYVIEGNESTSTVLNLSNAPNTTICVRKQTYTDATSGVNNTCYSLLVYKDAEEDSNGKIVFTNGSNQINSTLYQKNGRHAAAISQFLHAHQKGEQKHIKIFEVQEVCRKN